LINDASRGKLYWDFLIIGLAIYNSITTPLKLAYPNYSIAGWIDILAELIITLFFLVDIIISFRTYKDSATGHEQQEKEWDWKFLIKKQALSGNFFIDFISTIPFDVLNLGSLRLFGMLKIVRIRRLSKIIR